MNLIYQFRRLVFAQVLLGIVAFSIAERNPAMLLVAGAVAALSWYVTEGPSGRPLPRLVTNLGALATVVWLVADLVLHQGNLVIAMGHFTMWLQIVLLYTGKSNREYGQLLVLSLMQMIAASVLSISILYGVLLAAYCVLALVTVLLFQLKTTSDRVMEANQHAAPPGHRAGRPKAVTSRGYRWHFRGMAMTTGLICAAVAVMVFVITPRSDAPRYDPGGTGEAKAYKQAGFSESVELDESPGQTASKEPVLNVQLTADGEDIGGNDRPFLLRGAALDEYNTRSHNWTRGNAAGSIDRQASLRTDGPDQSDSIQLADVPESVPMREARITLRQSGHRVLFTPYPSPVWLQSKHLSQIQFNALDQQLKAGSRTGAVIYRVRMPRQPLQRMQQRYQRIMNPKREDGRFNPDPTPQHATDEQRANYGRGWPVQTKRVRKYALEVLQQHNLSRDPSRKHTGHDKAIATVLAEHLASEFTYTLENPPVPEGQDPVIKFLFERRRGHCELFAAAHAAMCRSIGIPARLVTGYRATEYNRIGGYYTVRQKNAHAWTEVYCGRAQGWRRFDATPAADVAAEHAPERGWLSAIREMYDYAEFLWIRSVVAYDQQTREQVIDEMQSSVTEPAQDESRWLGQIVGFFKRLPDLWRSDQLTWTLAGIIIIALGLAVGSLIRTGVVRRRRMAALQLTALPRTRRRGLARRLKFYLKMLDMLERYGYVRPEWQSPQAFANELAEANPLRFDPVVALTEIFYEVRFGHRELDQDRKNRIYAHLKQLERALSEQRD